VGEGTRKKATFGTKILRRPLRARRTKPTSNEKAVHLRAWGDRSKESWQRRMGRKYSGVFHTSGTTEWKGGRTYGGRNFSYGDNV